MTREEKILKRKQRAVKRRQKKMEKYVSKIQQARAISGYRVPLSALDKYGRFSGSWRDSRSSTGYSQVCDYFGICDSPCNGDC